MALPLDQDERNRFLEHARGAVVLSQRDFDRAVALALDPEPGTYEPPPKPLDQAALQDATQLAGTANAPGTLGVVADCYARTGQRFAGEVFLVASDPMFDKASGRVQVTDYEVVAVRLTGTASWVGSNASFAINTAVVGEPGRCCGRNTICVPDGGGPDGGGPDGGGWSPIAITPRTGVTSIAPEAQLVREQSGAPRIRFTVFHSGPDRIGLPERFPHTCTRVIADPGCQIAKPLCGHDDTGFTPRGDGAGDTGSGSTPCRPAQGAPVTSRNVPEICKHIMSPEHLPAKCGGWCESCQMRPPRREAFCAYAKPVPGGGSACDPVPPGQALLDNERRKLEFGWTEPTDAGTRCRSTGRDGIESCITCDTHGSCWGSVRRPLVDPTVADATSDAETSEEEDDPWAPAPVVITFDPVYVTGKAPSSANPPLSDPPLVNAPDDVPGPDTGDPLPPPGPGVSPYRLRPEDLLKADPDGGHSEKPGGGVAPAPAPANLGGTSVADPVDLGDGALVLDHTDLSFPGPVWPLNFARRYRSTSIQRSGLGSNWTHNWDVRVEPLTGETMPEFLSPWYGGLPPRHTGVLLRDGNAGTQMFALDIATQLYLPQAGGTGTLRETTEGGWAIRNPDGRIRVFNSDGYLVSDRDRCGVGFAVGYEPTPLEELFRHTCSPAQLAERNEMLTSRRNWLLAWLTGRAERPGGVPDGWAVTADDFAITGSRHTAERLRYAVDYLLHISRASTTPQVPDSVDGGRRLRPVTVTDDLGRQLVLEYHSAPRLRKKLDPSPRFKKRYDFAGHPEAGLLARVRGPAGAVVTFGYDRPVGYPRELNETFLTSVTRADDDAGAADVVPAADRELRFEYQWPTVDSSRPRPPSYDGWYEEVERRYWNYFVTFTGCWYRDVQLCTYGEARLSRPRRAAGNATELARTAANAVVSSVADNIITVSRDGVVETETRYQADPRHPDFERVTAQRYGSSSAAPDLTRIPPDDPDDHWLTGLPKATIEHVDAGPVDGVPDADRTDAFLPTVLRDRYLLEAPPERPPPAGPGPVAPGDTQLGPSCDYAGMAARTRELPGWCATIGYYPPELQHPQFTSPLARTRLCRDQLVVAQVADPAHNDLTATPVPGPQGGPRAVVERLLGRRRQVAANANRICAWTRLTDRDGDVTYFGVNYLGQPLVIAVADGDGFVVTERLVNADGRVVQERRPTRTATAWTPAAGDIRYTFDEIDPDADRGWAEWLPAFWARRGNLIVVEQRAPWPGVLDEDESSGAFVTSIGRYTLYGYDPLFNQPIGVWWGALAQRPGTDAPERKPTGFQQYLLDYQELSLKLAPSDPGSLLPMLTDLEGWGFHWARTATGEYDLTVITDWQLPLPLYGTDLNGDGALGDRYADRPEKQAKGLPVVAITGVPGSDGTQVTLARWAPHGLPAGIVGPDGDCQRFTYHPLAAPFGGAEPPAAGAGADYAGQRGMLARHDHDRFLGAYPASWGPPGQPPCSALAGPYQWLLPANTPADQIEPALHGLGLPEDVVRDIVDSSDPADPAAQANTRFSYAITGHHRRMFAATGRTSTVTDTDGRPRTATDERGIRTEHDYDTAGNVTVQRRYDSTGKQTGEVRYTYDEAGNPLSCTAALGPGAFAAPPLADRTTIGFAWTGEGQLWRQTDPAGTVTTYRYTGRKQLSGAVTTSADGARSRGVAYRRDVDGRVTGVHYGPVDDTVQGILVEKAGYDGLGRVVRSVDHRGVTWQHAWSLRDLPTRTRRSAAPYGAAIPVQPIWERRNRYDAFGRPAAASTNGVELQRTEWSVGGRALRDGGSGRGTTYRVSDTGGIPVWIRSPDGTVTVTGYRDQPHRSWSATLRTSPSGSVPATVTVHDLDPAGLPLSETRSAAGIEVTRSWMWDDAGNSLRVADTAGHAVDITRNWAGWPVRTERSRGPGAGTDDTVAEYDPRGLPELVTDPAGQETQYTWNPFGQLTGWVRAGHPQPTASFGYDGLGRPRYRTIGDDTLRVVRDQRGDPIRIEYDTQTGPAMLLRRDYDELGRLRFAEHTNPALPDVAAGDRRVRCTYTYDDLGRTDRETITVGAQPTTVMTSTWSLGGDTAQRAAELNAGGTINRWLERYDRAGRLVLRDDIVPVGPPHRVTFNWIGEWYAGRAHQQPGLPSPLREQIDLDPFGLPARIRYTVVDLLPTGAPQSLLEGKQYCAGTWNPAVCGRPLLEITMARDPVGRLGIRQLAWGNPRTTGSSLITEPQPVRWSGYAYTARQQLGLVYEAAVPAEPIVVGPPPGSYQATAEVVAAAAHPTAPWSYHREEAVGGTTDITDGTTHRWQLTHPRGEGHQLSGVEADAAQQLIRHDPAGRITGIGRTRYTWHPDGHLATVEPLAGADERYAYTHDGRLAAVWTGPPAAAPTQRFAYDGVHMITAVAGNGRLWDAAWGSGLDHLLAWTDHAGGTGLHLTLADQRGTTVGLWRPGAGLAGSVDHTAEGRATVRDPDGAVVCTEPGTGQVCTGPAGLSFGWSGTWRSGTTGLIWMRHRWYDPTLGQFISQDPIGPVDSDNLYAYADFDPVNGKDPFGLAREGFTPRAPERRGRRARTGELPSPSDVVNRLSPAAGGTRAPTSRPQPPNASTPPTIPKPPVQPPPAPETVRTEPPAPTKKRRPKSEPGAPEPEIFLWMSHTYPWLKLGPMEIATEIIPVAGINSTGPFWGFIWAAGAEAEKPGGLHAGIFAGIETIFQYRWGESGYVTESGPIALAEAGYADFVGGAYTHDWTSKGSGIYLGVNEGHFAAGAGMNVDYLDMVKLFAQLGTPISPLRW